MDIIGYVIQSLNTGSVPGTWVDIDLLSGDGVTDNANRTLFVVDAIDLADSPTRLAPDTTYYFRIRAQTIPDTEGDDQKWSGGTTATSPKVGAASAKTMAGKPSAPVLAAAPGDANEDELGSVRLTLTLSTSTGGSSITRYELQVWHSGQWNVAEDLDDITTAQVVEGFTPGVRYYFIARAWNSAGSGPWSQTVSEVALAGDPDTPELTATVVDGGEIKLTWTVPDDNGTPITGYELQEWGTDDWTGINLLAGGLPLLTEFTHSGLQSGTTHYYRIRAMPAADDNGWSNAAMNRRGAPSAKTLGDVPGKAVLTDSNVVVSETTITLTWTRLTGMDTGGSSIIGYDVARWNRSSQMWDIIAELDDVTTYADTGLANGATYYYRLRARNSEGPGGWSEDYASAMILAGGPDEPVLAGEALDPLSIRLTWVAPDNDGGSPITDYSLHRWDPVGGSDNNGVWTADLLGTDNTLVTLHVDGADSTLPTDVPAVAPGKTYYYRMTATNATNNNGNGMSGYSEVLTVTTDAAAPARVMDLAAATDGDDAIDLKWSAAVANGSAVIRYELQVWNKVAGQWDDVNTAIGSTRTSYKHTGLDADTGYAYRIRAINRAPDGGLGAYSTMAFGRTD
jgi:hypothetical protein